MRTFKENFDLTSLAQVKLAKLLDVHINTVSNWYTGKTEPDDEEAVLAVLAEHLVDDLPTLLWGMLDEPDFDEPILRTETGANYSGELMSFNDFIDRYARYDNIAKRFLNNDFICVDELLSSSASAQSRYSEHNPYGCRHVTYEIARDVRYMLVSSAEEYGLITVEELFKANSSLFEDEEEVRELLMTIHSPDSDPDGAQEMALIETCEEKLKPIRFCWA